MHVDEFGIKFVHGYEWVFRPLEEKRKKEYYHAIKSNQSPREIYYVKRSKKSRGYRYFYYLINLIDGREQYAMSDGISFRYVITISPTP